MPILRHLPGDVAPRSGTYALVGHYGEVTGFAVRCHKGDRLPFVVADGEYGELWFVLVDEAQPQGSTAVA